MDRTLGTLKFEKLLFGPLWLAHWKCQALPCRRSHFCSNVCRNETDWTWRVRFSGGPDNSSPKILSGVA